MVSQTPSKLLVYRECTQTLQVQGLYDNEEQQYWTANDSVSGTLIDEFGNQIFCIALAFASGSNGNFSGDFGGLTFLPNVGRGYTMVIKGVRSDGTAITAPILAEVVPAPSFTGGTT